MGQSSTIDCLGRGVLLCSNLLPQHEHVAEETVGSHLLTFRHLFEQFGQPALIAVPRCHSQQWERGTYKKENSNLTHTISFITLQSYIKQTTYGPFLVLIIPKRRVRTA